MKAKNQSALAEALGMSRAALSSLTKEPDSPKKGLDGFDVEEWKKWHDQRRVNRGRMPRHAPAAAVAAAMEEAKTKTIPVLRAEGLAIANEKNRLKVAEMQGRLIPKETVEMVLGKFVAELRSKHLAVKAQAPRLAMMTDAVEIERLLGDALTSAMEGVSRLPWKPNE